MKHGAAVLGPWHQHRNPLCPRPLAKRERPRAKRHSSHAARRLTEVQYLQPPLAASTVFLQPGPAGGDCCEPRRPSAADAHALCVAAQLGSARLFSGPKRPGGCLASSPRRQEGASAKRRPSFPHRVAHRSSVLDGRHQLSLGHGHEVTGHTYPPATAGQYPVPQRLDRWHGNFSPGPPH